jgi:hypothetical protein
MKPPSLLELNVRDRPEAFFTVTVAPGTKPPEGSDTIPVMLPRSCAKPAHAASKRQNSNRNGFKSEPLTVCDVDDLDMDPLPPVKQ